MGDKTRQSIGYISADIPKVEFPRLEGDCYEALVPDTLDIAERADYGIHCLTNLADPEADYEIWWHAVMNHKPPVVAHDFHDLNIQFKLQEALPLLRTITGNTVSPEVDEAWAEGLLRMQGDDGLIYMPMLGRPWARQHADWLSEDGWSEADQLASMAPNSGLTGVLGLYYRLSGDELWRARGQPVGRPACAAHGVPRQLLLLPRHVRSSRHAGVARHASDRPRVYARGRGRGRRVDDQRTSSVSQPNGI